MAADELSGASGRVLPLQVQGLIPPPALSSHNPLLNTYPAASQTS